MREFGRRFDQKPGLRWVHFNLFTKRLELQKKITKKNTNYTKNYKKNKLHKKLHKKNYTKKKN